jgi:hypothetical protein
MAKFPKLSREKIVFQLLYKPTLSFYDQLFNAASQLPGYPDWETDSLRVVLKDPTNKCSAAISHNSLTYDQDSANSSIESERVSTLLSFAKDKISKVQYTRFGLRQQFICPVEMTPIDLAKVMNVKLNSNTEELTRVIGTNITDLYFKVDSTEDELKYHFFITPVIKNTIPQHLNFNRYYHMPPEERAINYGRLLSNYPDVAIFIDIDCYTDSALKIEIAQAFYEKAKSISNLKAKKIVEYILASKIEE